MDVRTLLVLATATASALGAQATPRPSCAPPDSSFLAEWSLRAEPGDPARPEQGVIPVLNPVPVRHFTPAQLIGRFRLRHVRMWRQAPAIEDTTYLVLRSPPAGQHDSLLRASGDTLLAVGVLTFVLPTRGTRTAPHRVPLQATSALPYGLFLRVEPAPGALDAGDTYVVWQVAADGFRGWGPGGASLVPESIDWFCAERL